MNLKPISPKLHCLLDYALVGSLLILPSILKLNRKARSLYTAEAAVLLGYVGITESPVAVKPIIPFKIHGKIDPFNIAHFGLQSFMPQFKKDKRALIFNLAFTLAAGLTVALTDWKGSTKR